MVIQPLTDADLDPDPVVLFEQWFAHAQLFGQPEPEAMALASATSGGDPAVRFVLLRGFDHRGFVFYTNAHSRKGIEVADNPKAALAFRWSVVDRQVRITGSVSPVESDESDRYFASRARGSQLGAWASDQSQPIPDRERLEDRLTAVTAEFAGRQVPRPSWWGGYRVAPAEMEFWQQGPDRLHDRFRYARSGDRWSIQRLSP